MAENESHIHSNPSNEIDGTDTRVDVMLDQVQESVNEIRQVTDSGASGLSLPDLSPKMDGHGLTTDIEFLSDVNLHVMIELGRTEMVVEDVLKLTEGSVVELNKLAGDPVDVYVNNRLIARGEVLVLNDNFCIRISEIVANLEEQVGAVAAQHHEGVDAM